MASIVTAMTSLPHENVIRLGLDGKPLYRDSVGMRTRVFIDG
ncbi:hypothetical protein [Alloactinosynnema sp. L-07]|nr:hypothetical protein [Alloactinosynnema sp. L-07]